MDAYDTIKRYYNVGFPVSDLKEFVGTLTEDDLTSGVFMNNMDDFDQSSFLDVVRKVCCCACCKSNSSNAPGPTGYTTLTSIIK